MSTTIHLKNRKQVDAWRDLVLAKDKRQKEREAQWAKDYIDEHDTLADLYASITNVLRMLTKFPNYAVMVQVPNAPSFYTHYSQAVIDGFEKRLWDDVRTSKRQAEDLRRILEDKYSNWRAMLSTHESILQVSERVLKESALMHAIHYIYWHWKHRFLKERFDEEPTAALLVKVAKAKRMLDYSSERRQVAVGMYYKRGGSEKVLTDLIYDDSFATSDPHCASAANAYAAFCNWMDEQKAEGEALVGAMVGRVIVAVKKRQFEEHRAAQRQEKLDAEAARKTKSASRHSSLLIPLMPVDPKVKALEALRKLNREKALKTERVLAQRRRTAKALEAEEKLAQAAEARAVARGARVSR